MPQPVFFSPLGGWRNNNPGTTAEEWPGTYGQYFTDESINTNDCYRLDISPGEGKPMSIAHQRKWHTKLVVSKDLNYIFPLK